MQYEVLIDMHEAGYALYRALDAAKKAAASAGDVPDELAVGAGNDGVIPPSISLNAAEMTSNQKALLLTAIDQWVSKQPSEEAARRMTEIEADLDRTRFAWTGANEVNTPTHMRIRGPALIIEFLSTGGRARSGRGTTTPSIEIRT